MSVVGDIAGGEVEETVYCWLPLTTGNGCADTVRESVVYFFSA